MSELPASSAKGSDTVEAVICQDSDIKENEMKVFEMGKEGDQVLLVKQNGKVYAIGNKCTHYGAPLVNGALGKGRVRCPWHGACFNIATGDIEDFPGLDSIPRYNCAIITGGGVKVTASKALLKANRRDKISSMSSRDSKVSTTFVVVGGGAAGNNCAETLRREGFQGRVVMVCGENYLPYDRIKLSKMLNAEYENIKLRPPEFYRSADIEVLLNTKAVKIKTDQKALLLHDGSQINYNKIFIATGARGRTIKYPGSSLGNIFTLRSINDGIDIYKQFSKDKNLVILGSSFIGMEVASFAVGKVKSVTVVSRSNVPFDTTLGNEIGGRIHELFVSKGVNFVMNQVVEKYDGKDDNKVSEVILKNGTSLPADIVVIGLGIDLNTDFLAGSEIIMRMDGSIPVDKFLETNVKGVYAGGDIAFAPVYANGDKPDAIGHWQLAHYHGYIAALNMVGKPKPLQTIPFFWSVLFGLSFRYAGYGAGHTQVVTTGDLKGLKFVSYYIRNDIVVAVITCGSDPIAAKFAELLALNKKLKKSDVVRTKVDWFEQPLYT